MANPTGTKGGLLDTDFGVAPVTPNTDRAKSVIRRRLIMFSLGTLLTFYAYSSYETSRFAARPMDDLNCTSHRASVGVDPEMVWEKASLHSGLGLSFERLIFLFRQDPVPLAICLGRDATTTSLLRVLVPNYP